MINKEIYKWISIVNFSYRKKFLSAVKLITNILKNLEKKNYIVRESDAKDMRRVSVTLTGSGREYIAGVYEKMIDQHEKIFRALGEHDSLELVRILKRGHDLMTEGKL